MGLLSHPKQCLTKKSIFLNQKVLQPLTKRPSQLKAQGSPQPQHFKSIFNAKEFFNKFYLQILVHVLFACFAGHVEWNSYSLCWKGVLTTGPPGKFLYAKC